MGMSTPTSRARFEHGWGGVHSFGDGSRRHDDVVQRSARRQLLAEATVAAVGAAACRDEVAVASQAKEGERSTAEGHAEARDLGEAHGR